MRLRRRPDLRQVVMLTMFEPRMTSASSSGVLRVLPLGCSICSKGWADRGCSIAVGTRLFVERLGDARIDRKCVGKFGPYGGRVIDVCDVVASFWATKKPHRSEA